jgi:AcrR family transcriptional regulator
VKAEPAQRLENMLQHVRNLFYDRPDRIRLILSALIERGPENEEVREGVARIMGVMRDAIARGMSVLPMPPHRVHGLATLALQVLTGAFLDYFSNPDPALFEQRLKVIRKMLALFVEHEIKQQMNGAAARPSA